MSQTEANLIVRAVQRARRSRHAGLKFALPTVAALGAGAAVAIGSIPGSDGTITGCYWTNTDITSVRYGTLRVIDPQPQAAGQFDPAHGCSSDEATIAWNQRGPQGPVGPQGAQGPAGSPLIGETSFGVSGGGRMFLKIDGISGESTDKTHKSQIDLLGFSFGARGQGSSGGGGGAGKATIQSFTITKRLDKASPLLFKAAATGKHFAKVEVAFAHKRKGKQQDYLEYKLANVLVSSIQDGTSHKGTPEEQVTFSFQKATEVFLGSNGKPIQKLSITISGKVS